MGDSDLDDMLSDAAPAAIVPRAQQWFSEGQVAAANGDFSSATVLFQRAHRLLGRAPQAGIPDQELEPLQTNLAAVALIVALAEQAEAERSRGRRDLALATLDDIAEQLERMRDEASIDNAILAAVEALRLAINGELERIADEDQQLAKGERFLAQKRFDQAAARFRAASEALLPETQQRAEAGLRRVEEEIQAFEADIRQAQKETDPHGAVDQWQRAYDRWPSGHGVTAHLVQALVHAGEAALAEGQEKVAHAYVDRALKLKPNDQKAGEARRLLERFEQIKVSIAQVRGEIDQLTHHGDPAPKNDTDLHERLVQLLDQAGDLPALRGEITALLQAIEQRQKHGQALVLADEVAAQQAAAGDWAAAVRSHAAALAGMGDPPPIASQRHADWQAAETAIAAARQDGDRLRNSAQTTYDEGRSSGDFIAALALLDQIDQLVARAEQKVQIVGVPLPNDLLTLSDNVDTLRRRAEVARQALSEPTIQQGLSGTREALRVLGDDATLGRIAEHLASQHSRQAPELLDLAQQAEDQDALGDALDYLRQAREIDPEIPNLAERLEQIGRRRRFEEALQRAEVDAEVAGSSLTAVRGALRQALEVFLLAEYAIPNPTRVTIRELLSLGDEDVGEALANPAKWKQARDLRDQLLSAEGWANRRAAQITEQWLMVAREAAMRGAITSLAQIGDVVGAYRTAFNYRRIYQSEEAINFLERAQEGLRLSLIGQADKLLERARRALDKGVYATALDNLNRLEHDYYTPIEKEFPHLLNTLDENQEISEARREATDLHAEAEQLQQHAESIKQTLEQANRAFVASQFTEAEQLLQGIVHNEKLNDLKQSAETLKSQIERARKQLARRQIEEQLARASTAIKAETNIQNLDDLLVGLEQAAQTIDWEVLPIDDRPRLVDAIDQVREARSNLAAVDTWEADAEQARRQGDFEQALRSLQHAIDATRPGSKRARLQAKFDELDGRMRRKHLQDEAIQSGRQLLSKEDYDGALDAFARAQGFGADVEWLRKTARAGALLQSVRAAWNDGKDLAVGQANMNLANQLAQDNPEATLIAQELAFYRPLFKQRIDTIQIAVQDARAALAQNDLETAETTIQRALDADATHAEALRLQRDIRGRASTRTNDLRFHSLIERVEQERSRGNDRSALRLLNEAIELRRDDPIAVNLQADLNREQEANEIIRRARDAVYAGKFINARRLIQGGEEHANPALLREVRRLLEDLEAAYRANTVYPIRDLLRDERYREALRRCNDALKQVESDNLRADLIDLRSNIVKRWIEKASGVAQNKLHGADEEPAFREIAAELGAIKDELAAYPESQQIEHYIRQAYIGRLSNRLDRVEAFLQLRSVSNLVGISEQPVDHGGDDSVSGAPHTLVEARQSISAALQEAEELKLDRMCARARELQEAIVQQERFEEERDARLDRDAKLDQARLLLNRARGRRTAELADEDLVQARELALGVRRSERFRQDDATTKLLDEVEMARGALRETHEEIERSMQALGRGHFDDAQHYLRRIHTVYPLLQPRYAQLSALLNLLARADDLENRREWRAAYTAYREATQDDLAPDAILQTKIEHCQRRITEQVFQDARAALRALPPEPEQARTLLDTADTSGWLLASASVEIDNMRAWIQSRQRVVDAIALLNPTQADPAQALNLLREARRYSDPDSDDQVEQWTLLAQALHDWKADQLDAAYQLLGRIRQPVAAMPHVRTAQRIIREQILTRLRDQTRHALKTWDPIVAAQTIERGLRIASDDVELRRLSVRQQEIAQRAAEIRREVAAGWEALEQEAEGPAATIDWSRYQLAQPAFERVLAIDERFSEADHWRQYAQSMARGLQEAQEHHYENAARHLEAAERILETSVSEPRPVLLGNPERQQVRRRQAAAVAAQFAVIARDLDRLYRELDEYERQQDPDQALATIGEIERQEQALVAVSRNPVVTPLDGGNQRSPEQAAQGAVDVQDTVAPTTISVVNTQNDDRPHDHGRRHDASDSQE